ncbi:MAG: LamG-like jellyroll fold domain-containing protein, partial [Planctomycetota bacterium]
AADYIDCGNDASLDITGPITITAWIHPTGAGSSTYPRVVNKSTGTGAADPGYKIYPRTAENWVVTLSVGGGSHNSSSSVVLDTWNYLALVITGTQWKFYLNGTWQEWDDTRLPSSVSNPLFIGNSSTGARHLEGLMDDVRIYSRALTEEEVLQAMRGAEPGVASDPIPDDGATDVSRDVTLSWTPGEYAPAVNGHIVYLSDSFNDVNDGIGGVTLSAGSYAPGRLAFETTYYWRVDEVNAPPDSTVFPGAVWSFTTEPVGYPIDGTNITATASSVGQADFDPENTINGSGLDENDLHSTEATTMWVSGNEPLGTWIQYEFDTAYILHEMWVWNANQVLEPLFGFGFKDVTVEYSTDGTEWTALAGVPQFAQAPGTDDYAHDTTVDFGGEVAKYVKLTAASNWGGVLPQYGLSEVRFFSIPVSAREPSPDAGATDVDVDGSLTWRAGREAATHGVYLSNDQQAVIDGTAPAVTVTDASYSPHLDLADTYFWRVDEVNDAETPAIWQGDVWDFTTQKYIVVDGFEDYNDYPPDEIYTTWLDGYENPANGSQVGYLTPPTIETTIVHGDNQSMPLIYSNTGGATYSEGERTFATPQDWTKYGVKTLGLWFRGTSGNTGQLYVKVNGVKVPYDGDAGNLAAAAWEPWNIDLTTLGLNLQSITTLAIGIDGNGAGGTLYFDDIRLYPYERQLVTPTEPNTAGLVAHYKFDQDATDSSGNNNHGRPSGNPPWVAGKIGSAVELDGGHDYVDCGNSPSLNITGEITIAAWIYPTGNGDSNFPRIVDKSNGTGGPDPGYKIYLRAAQDYVVTLSAGGQYLNSSASVVLDTWNYVAVTMTGTQWRLHLNGTWEEWDETTLPSLSSNPLFIGHSPAGNRHFQGMIDDVRIYNRVLTPAEIAWLAGRTEPFDKPF